MNKQLFCCAWLMLCAHLCFGQADSASLYKRLYNLPDKLFGGMENRAQQMQVRMQQQTARYIAKLQQREKRLQRKIARKDTALARKLFGDTEALYASLSQKTERPPDVFSQVYSGRIDSMKTALQFLNGKGMLKDSRQLLEKYTALQGELNQTDRIQKILQERQQMLYNRLQQTPYAKALRRLREQVYTYRARMDEYKKLWEDPAALESKLTGLLAQTPAFRQFFNQHSDLSSVFSLPGGNTVAAGTPSMQSRASLNQFARTNLGSNFDLQSQISNNLPASGMENEWRSRLAQPGLQGTEEPMPDYNPVVQRKKQFLNRLEYGSTLQTVPADNFFPATSDLGFSIGYRINDKSITGIGASGKIGWGKSFSDIRVTGEGMSVRSFADIKLKGTYWISGGLEYNYQQPFTAVRNLKDWTSWHPGGLIGITRVIPVKLNGPKKYRVQLLYDFLHRSSVPATQPIRLRLGYSL